MKNRVIAIDFGTCNTYLSQSVNGGPAEEFNIAVGGDSAHGMKSVIMYRTKGDNAGNNEFGQEAINAFGGASPKKKEANGLELASSFKPDIEVSEKARQDSVCFLSNVLTEANKQNLHINPSDTDVFFGVPSEASEGYRACLRDIAKKAGWGDVRLLDEPFGALCYYQDENSEDVVKQMLQESVLVVDFGGGTCDFVVLENGEIKYSWGDMLLGGRLFDDLFYQWVIDCSQDSLPVTEEQLMKTNKDFYWRCIKCRELKEKFSNAMVKDKKCAYEEFFMDQYELELSWDEFVRRAQNYHPSQSFMNMTKLPADMSKTMFKPEGTTDILSWFEKELRRGFEISRIPIESIGKVLLAGGSSSWSFVREACQKIFGEEKLIRCTNPFAAISMGLVKYSKIKEVAMNKIQTLEQDVPLLVKQIVEKLFNSELSEGDIDSIVQISGFIFDKYAIPELNYFRDNGGTIENLEIKLKNLLSNHSSDIQSLLEPWFQKVGETINLNVQNDILYWFKAHNVNPEDFSSNRVRIDIPEFGLNSLDSMGTDVADSLGAMIGTAIGAAIIALIVGGLAFTGPIGWAIGAALAFGGGAVSAGFVQTMEWSPSWAAWLIDPPKVQKIRNEKFIPAFMQKFVDMYGSFLTTNKDAIEKAVQNAVEQELAQYKKVANMERGTRAGGSADAGFSSATSAGDAFGK